MLAQRCSIEYLCIYCFLYYDTIICFIFILESQYINTDEIMVTSNLFLDKEFDTFVKNGIFSKYINYKKRYNIIYLYMILQDIV